MDKRIETTSEAVQMACRAAYKNGLIDAAQAVCRYCRQERPERGRRPGFFHRGNCFECDARAIIQLLEDAGGWEAVWPKVTALKI